MDDDDPPRILVADDDEGLLELYRERLHTIADVTVVTASNGDEAWDHLDSSIDLALLDENMPGRSGIEIAAAIADADFHVPIVVVSGREPSEEQHWDAFLQKPVHLADLRRTLEDILS
jgi:CheY-like chemotaxis protein